MVEVTIENLNIKYGDFHAVKDVNLKIKDSEIVTLLGPSGCGKTSILRAIAGFVEPYSGYILIDDEDITHQPPQERDMGMIFQNYALWPHMSVMANVTYGLKVRKMPKEERKKKGMELLKQVQLDEHADKIPTQLSGGQQQRVALARALAIEPRVLLCDEPLSNLDFKLRVQLRTEIRDIAKEHQVTVVYVTHDQTEALAISDKVAVMGIGDIAQFGDPVSVFNDPNTKFVANFVGENNELSGVIDSIAKNRASIKLSTGEMMAINVSESDNLSKGDQVDLITRFDDLGFMTKGENSITGKLKHLAYMGTYLQIELALNDGTEFTVNVTENIPKYMKLPKNEEISIKIPDEYLMLFKDGERIR